MKSTYVLYHSNCYDGLGAALAAFMAFGEKAEYIPVNYGRPMPDIPEGVDVYILDFSYSRAELDKLAERVTLFVLDHHKSAKEELEGANYATFDMDKSGATMAFERFFPDEPTPLLLRYLEDRDLWRFRLPNSHEVSLALRAFPMDFRVWHGHGFGSKDSDVVVQQLIRDGEPILRYSNQLVHNICAHLRWWVFDMRNTPAWLFPLPKGGADIAYIPGVYVVPIANTSVLFSEAADYLLTQYENAPFAGYWFDRGEDDRQWGLRSRSKFDVSVIAKAFGGGGHAQASGFQTDPHSGVFIGGQRVGSK